MAAVVRVGGGARKGGLPEGAGNRWLTARHLR
jgi:hypothetical protein